MAVQRRREPPPDKEWLDRYITKLGLDIDPEDACNEMEPGQWARMKAAWRKNCENARLRSKPELSGASWDALERIRKGLGARDLDSLIERLGEVDDLDRLFRDDMARRKAKARQRLPRAAPRPPIKTMFPPGTSC